MAQSIKRTSTYLFILRIIRMLISVVTVTLTAKFFGVSIEKDSWVLATTVTTTIVMAVWGPINEIFRTKFVYIKEQEGIQEALKKTSSLIGLIFWVTNIIGFCIVVFSSYISQLLSSNIGDEARPVFAILLMALVPNMLLVELSNISISIFNSFEIYYIPEIVGFFTSIVGIAIILFFAPSLGIISLVISTYVSALILLTAILYFQKKHGLLNIWRRLLLFSPKDAFVFIVFALPFFFPYFTGQLNSIGEKYLAGLLGQGQISMLDYSRQFISILQNVISSVLTTVMVPMLAKAYINNRHDSYKKIFEENTIVCFVILACAFSFIVGATDPLCDFFFNRGKVSSGELSTIVALTRLFGIAFTGVLLYIMFGMSMLASNKRKQYAMLGVATQVFVFLFNVLGICVTKSCYVFPITFGLVHLLTAFVMMAHSKEVIDYTFIRTKGIALLGVFLPAVTIYIFNDITTIENRIVKLIISGVIMIMVFPMTLALMGINIKTYYSKIRKR